jgi:hypothetical protein
MRAEPFTGASIRAVERPAHGLGQPGAVVVEGAQGQLVLVAEGAVEAALAQAGGRGDVAAARGPSALRKISSSPRGV